MELRPMSWTWSAPGSGLLLCLVLLGVGLGGCASSRTGAELNERMRALGTWEYWTTGIGTLQRGTLQIATRDGDLVARFRDQWRGPFEADVRLQGTRMVIVLDRVRITGQIMHGQFRGTARTPEWDLTRASARREAPGTFQARRVHSPQNDGERDRYGCPSLLRETSYACSPFQPQ
jgi:hypothetical protein